MFIEKFCRFTKGDNAGEAITLLPWQRDEVIAPLFGWYNKDGTRRFRNASIWISKKNGKSFLVSALSAYMLLADGEAGAQCFSAAADRMQAGIIAREMIAMMKSHPSLLKQVEIVESRNAVLHRKSNSRYTVLSSDAFRAEGIDASFVAVDEVHSLPNDKLFRAFVMQRLLDATHSLSQSAQQDMTSEVSGGSCGDSQNRTWPTHPLIHLSMVAFGRHRKTMTMKTQKYGKKQTHHLAQRSLWTHSSPMRQKVATCQPRGIAGCVIVSIVLTQLQMFAGFVPVIGQGNEEPQPFGDRPVFCGLDLASTWDTTSFVAIAKRDDGTLDIHSMFFVPRDNAVEREVKDKVSYGLWTEQGYMIATPGNICDYEVVRQYIEEFCANHNVQQIACDKWNAASLMTQLYQNGIPVTGYGQGFSALVLLVNAWKHWLPAESSGTAATPCWHGKATMQSLLKTQTKTYEYLKNIRPKK